MTKKTSPPRATARLLIGAVLSAALGVVLTVGTLVLIVCYLFATRPLHGAGPFPYGIYDLAPAAGFVGFLTGLGLTWALTQRERRWAGPLGALGLAALFLLAGTTSVPSGSLGVCDRHPDEVLQPGLHFRLPLVGCRLRAFPASAVRSGQAANSMQALHAQIEAGAPGARANPQALERLSHNADPRQRSQALFELSQVGATPRVLARLRAALQDPDPGVRVDAATYLGILQGPQAADVVPLLRQGLRQCSADPDLTSLALDPLFEAVAKIGPGAKGALPELLARAREHQEPAADTNAAIQALGPAVVPDLVGFLSDPRPQVRLAAALNLASLDPSRAADLVPALAEGLQSRQGEWDLDRRGSEDAAARLGPAAHGLAAPLRELLAEPSLGAYERVGVVRALLAVEPGAPEALPALVRSLSPAEEQGLREQAVDLLAQAGPQGLAKLVQLLDDPDLSSPAAESLEQLDPAALPDEAIPALARAASEGRVSTAIAVLISLGDRAWPACEPLLQDPDHSFRGGVAWRLRTWPGTRGPVAKALLALAEGDPSIEVQQDACGSLSRLGPEGCAALEADLERLDVGVLTWLARDLAKQGTPEARALLKTLAECSLSHGSYLRKTAREELERLGAGVSSVQGSGRSAGRRRKP